ncbi:unnamed protein product [Spodoptera littoralis]|uniref:Uncharacterized protein n=1 Tax=Spodoptera littoralis TaxID=7109 RepID=A0A9P0HYK8_SPOLI|nr:unnamed protein product [Spodoptera littoralis]CAH1636362.1 unnamed protein product [Spodoptera littoralis]
MNRTPRRGRATRHEISNRFIAKNKVPSDAEDSHHSPFRHRSKEKTVANRCCYVTPDKKDFGQSYGPDRRSRDKRPHQNILAGTKSFQYDHYRTLLKDQYGFDPSKSETIAPFRDKFKRVPNLNNNKVESRPHYIQKGTSPAFVETPDGSHWQNVDNIDELETIVTHEDTPTVYEHLPKHIYISEVPRVKIIAEKFSKYKKNNIELRRLDEKVVCVEYSIYDGTSKHDLRPIQRMRAFFSIKPSSEDDSPNHESGKLPSLPPSVKHQFDILDEDLKKLTDKEIEIIDGKIEDNRSYLEDLRRILKRKQVIHAKKNRKTLDLESLYQMAKRDVSSVGCGYSGANLLSKAELQDVKDLILHRCTSSVHGIRRKSIKRKDKGSGIDYGLISETIVAELLRDDGKLSV